MKPTCYPFLLSFFFIISSCKEQKSTKLEVVVDETGQLQEQIERGEYLVNILGCTDCHTPKKMTERGPVPDMEKFLMGFDATRSLPPIPENVPLGSWVLFAGDLTAAVGPWGTSYAGNLTPHETGLGNWSLEQFRNAIQGGKYKGLDNARPIMPPMPVAAYKQLSNQDVDAIFKYLRTIPAIDNVVPEYQTLN